MRRVIGYLCEKICGQLKRLIKPPRCVSRLLGPPQQHAALFDWRASIKSRKVDSASLIPFFFLLLPLLLKSARCIRRVKCDDDRGRIASWCVLTTIIATADGWLFGIFRAWVEVTLNDVKISDGRVVAGEGDKDIWRYNVVEWKEVSVISLMKFMNIYMCYLVKGNLCNIL